MMKRLCAALVFLLILTAAISAQDRIAVLDTELPKGIDTKVVIPITEKIMEEFVRSKLFIVLDRSFIAKTLSELEFSTSDLTAGDTDKLATIGGFLKATYIVVSTVQLLDRTYFLSAKMIEVKSGVIVAQSSVNRDGSVSVLIDMAGELGQKLVSAAMGQEAKPNTRTATQKTAPATTKEPAAAKPAREPKARSSRFSTVSVDIGTGNTIATEVDTEYNYFTWINGDFEAVAGSSYGLSCVLPLGLLYISANGSLTTAEYDNPLDYVTSEAFVAGMGFGIDLLLGPVLTYAGARVGYMSVSITDEYTSGMTEYNTWSGISYGFELGGDIRLGSLALGVRYLTDLGTLVDENGYYSDMDATIDSLSLRLGWAF